MYRVLIVEDDPMVSMINAQYIGQNGLFKVVGQCPDGASALEFLENNPVDLAIFDVYMPRMDGLETLRRIRDKKLPVSVIMVTAANDAEALEEALRLGAVDYLVKPFTFDRLQTALERFVSQKDALSGAGRLSQQKIDSIMGSAKGAAEIFPKGIQEKTLLMITECLSGSGGRWITGDEVAESTGLSGVTVRRYMNYLVETGKVQGKMDYGTGGRPGMRYRLL